MGSEDLLRIVRTTVDKHSMISRGDGIVAGVSGGPDSVAMLVLLVRLAAEYDLRVCAAHLNHMIRGYEADLDQRYVEDLCRSLHVHLVAERVDVVRDAKERGVTVEDAGRHARYDLFARVAKTEGLNRIAVAHNADDQAETVLMRLIRGTGPRGLGGIPPVRKLDAKITIIRPLIDAGRADIEAFCAACGLNPREDRTNYDTAYFRNRVRRQLLPMLEREYNPNIRSSLTRLAQVAAEDECYLQLNAQEWLEAARSDTVAEVAGAMDGNFVSLKRAELTLAPQPLLARVFSLAYAEVAGDACDLYSPHISALTRLVHGGTVGDSLDLPRGVRARLTYEELVMEKPDHPRGVCDCGCDVADSPDSPCAKHAVRIGVPGAQDLPWAGVRVYAAVGAGPNGGDADLESILGLARTALAQCGYDHVTIDRADAGARWAVFDADQLGVDEVVARPWRAADRIAPYGLHGSKKLSDIFIDAKVPREERGMYPVLFAGCEYEAIWIAGLRASRTGQVTSATTHLLVLVSAEIGNPEIRRV